jgi:hypothetical protein
MFTPFMLFTFLVYKYTTVLYISTVMVMYWTENAHRFITVRVPFIIAFNVCVFTYYYADSNTVYILCCIVMLLTLAIDTDMIYSTMYMIMSYTLGSCILNVYEPYMYAFSSITHYAFMYSVIIGAPLILSMSVIVSLINEPDVA